MKLALGALVLVLVAGCGGKSAAPTKTVTVTASPETASSAPSPSPTDDPAVAKFGEVVTFEDGLEVTISKPVRFTPSSGADLDGYPLPKKGVPVRFTVTMHNTGSRAIPPDLPLLTVTSAGRSLEDVGIEDPAFEIDGLAKEARILPGKKLVSNMGYYVVSPRDVEVDIEFGNYDTLTFSNAGG